VKGKAKVVIVHKLLMPLSRSASLGGESQSSSTNLKNDSSLDFSSKPIVGRKEQTAKMMALFEAISRGDKGYMMVLTGDAGMGKSMLVSHVRGIHADRVDQQQVKVLVGKASVYNLSQALAPWRQLFLTLFQKDRAGWFRKTEIGTPEGSDSENDDSAKREGVVPKKEKEKETADDGTTPLSKEIAILMPDFNRWRPLLAEALDIGLKQIPIAASSHEATNWKVYGSAENSPKGLGLPPKPQRKTMSPAVSRRIRRSASFSELLSSKYRKNSLRQSFTKKDRIQENRSFEKPGSEGDNKSTAGSIQGDNSVECPSTVGSPSPSEVHSGTSDMTGMTEDISTHGDRMSGTSAMTSEGGDSVSADYERMSNDSAFESNRTYDQLVAAGKEREKEAAQAAAEAGGSSSSGVEGERDIEDPTASAIPSPPPNARGRALTLPALAASPVLPSSDIKAEPLGADAKGKEETSSSRDAGRDGQGPTDQASASTTQDKKQKGVEGSGEDGGSKDGATHPPNAVLVRRVSGLNGGGQSRNMKFTTNSPKLNRVETQRSLLARRSMRDKLACNSTEKIGTSSEKWALAMSPGLKASRVRDILVLLLNAAGPLVIILEDAQNFDSLTWQLLHEVCESCPRVGVVLTTRPMLKGENAVATQILNQLESKESTVSIPVSALDQEETTELVSRHLNLDRETEDVPEELVNMLYSKTRGHPLYMVEILTYISDQQRQQADGDGDELTKQVVATTTASSAGALSSWLRNRVNITSVITARIDKLPPTQQLTLKVASVLGERIVTKWLLAIHPMHSSNQNNQGLTALGLERDLKDLCTKQYITADPSMPNEVFHFESVILRDMAYELIPFSQRRVLHAKLADELVEQNKRYNEEGGKQGNNAPTSNASLGKVPYDTISYHYNQAAGTMADDEQLSFAYRTLDFLEIAAEESLKRNAGEEVIRLFNKAQKLASRVIDKVGPDVDEVRPSRMANWQRLIAEQYISAGGPDNIDMALAHFFAAIHHMGASDQNDITRELRRLNYLNMFGYASIFCCVYDDRKVYTPEFQHQVVLVTKLVSVFAQQFPDDFETWHTFGIQLCKYYSHGKTPAVGTMLHVVYEGLLASQKVGKNAIPTVDEEDEEDSEVESDSEWEKDYKSSEDSGDELARAEVRLTDSEDEKKHTGK